MVSWMSLPPFANWKAVASHGWMPAAVGSSSSNSTSGSLTRLRVPMAEVTELESYGLKSSEKVTPVVGSAIRGLPPEVVAGFDCWQAPNARAATPSSQHAATWSGATATLGGALRLQTSIANGHRG